MQGRKQYVLLALCTAAALSACSGLGPPDVSDEVLSPTAEQKRILDACDERLPDYDDFRLLNVLPTEMRTRRYNFLVKHDPGDGRRDVVVGGRIPESSLAKDPLIVQPSECAGMAFPAPEPSP